MCFKRLSDQKQSRIPSKSKERKSLPKSFRVFPSQLIFSNRSNFCLQQTKKLTQTDDLENKSCICLECGGYNSKQHLILQDFDEDELGKLFKNMLFEDQIYSSREQDSKNKQTHQKSQLLSRKIIKNHHHIPNEHVEDNNNVETDETGQKQINKFNDQRRAGMLESKQMNKNTEQPKRMKGSLKIFQRFLMQLVTSTMQKIDVSHTPSKSEQDKLSPSVKQGIAPLNLQKQVSKKVTQKSPDDIELTKNKSNEKSQRLIKLTKQRTFTDKRQMTKNYALPKIKSKEKIESEQRNTDTATVRVKTQPDSNFDNFSNAYSPLSDLYKQSIVEKNRFKLSKSKHTQGSSEVKIDHNRKIVQESNKKIWSIYAKNKQERYYLRQSKIIQKEPSKTLLIQFKSVQL